MTIYLNLTESKFKSKTSLKIIQINFVPFASSYRSLPSSAPLAEKQSVCWLKPLHEAFGEKEGPKSPRDLGVRQFLPTPTHPIKKVEKVTS